MATCDTRTMVWAPGNHKKVEHSKTKVATGPWSTGHFWVDNGPSFSTPWDTPDALGWTPDVGSPPAMNNNAADATGPWSTGSLWVDNGPSLLTPWDTPEVLGWNTYTPCWEDNSWWDTRNFEEEWCRSDLSAVWRGPVTAIVKFEKPAITTHHLPAYPQKIAGRLLVQRGGVMFYPFDARRTELTVYEPSTSATKSDEEAEEQEALNDAKRFLSYAKTGNPRIMFRGFHSKSGGGGDPRLNGPNGVFPHAFLNGKEPTNMWDIPDLREMVNDHLTGWDRCASAFSSWTHFWRTAIHFSHYKDERGTSIAVLDTTSMEDHVWFSEDLWCADVSEYAWSDEYLLYGPITGPKYHCISPDKLYRTTNIKALLNGSTFVFGEDPGLGAIERAAIVSARKVAAFLQPRGASTENLAILTARFVSYRAHKLVGKWQRCMYDVDLEKYTQFTRDDIQVLAMRADGWDISLVDGTMDTRHCRCLKYEVQLLQAVENVVHALAWSV
ncbi:hypothetical protein INS49_013665 [Diaporthe citri]|uniref:uncharacterized protein n=1 Tax=Diaporthe citri TaxID=83186 RepID=UPI001C7F0C72|nr:uncharacterized protein INS49_013665 [Diaporthe citri]KAG6357786.1 hypothetical protein INS49_013665 [Diaporthe citri]